MRQKNGSSPAWPILATWHHGSRQHHRVVVVGDDREVPDVDGIEQAVERGPVARLGAEVTDRVLDAPAGAVTADRRDTRTVRK